jgi:hypothetical protein
VLGFLRLLPPLPDAPVLEGQVQIVSGPAPETRSRFSFARDGSSVAWTANPERVPSGTYFGRLPDEPVTPGYSQAIFELSDGAGFVLNVTGEDDTISIWATDLSADRTFLEFEGERDGCD